MTSSLLIICLSAIIVPAFSDFVFLGDYFNIPPKLIQQFVSGERNVDDYFQRAELDNKENLHFNLGFEHGQQWGFARWSALFPWELYADEIDTWIQHGGETNVSKRELSGVLRDTLGMTGNPINFLKNWINVFLVVHIPVLAQNVPIPLHSESIPRELRDIIPTDGKNRYEWFLDLFTYILNNIKEKDLKHHEIRAIIHILIGKIKLFTTQFSKSDIFHVVIKGTDHSITVRDLGYSLTNFYKKIYPDWKPQTTQLLLNIALRFIVHDGMRGYKLEKLPQFIKLIVHDINVNEPNRFIFQLLQKIKRPTEEISPDVFNILREITSNMRSKVLKPVNLPYDREEQFSTEVEESAKEPLPKKSDVIALFIQSMEYKVPITTVRDTITKLFTRVYSNWHPRVSQWFLNAIVQFLDSEDPKTFELSEIPIIIQSIIPDANDKKPLELMLTLLETFIQSSETELILPKILVVFKEIRYKVEKALNLPSVSKLIIYKGKYIPVGQNGTRLLNIQPISAGKQTDLVKRWLMMDGIMKPIGYDDQPILVITVPIIRRWVVVNHCYIAIGADEQLVPNMKPLAPVQKHPFVLRWIRKGSILIPENPDGSIPLINVVVKWVYSNNVYQAFGEEGNTIPGLPTFSPGQVLSFITWRQSNAGLVPIGPDGKELIVEGKRKVVLKENVVRWISVHDRFLPIGPDDQPLVGHSFLRPGDMDPLISKWIDKYGKLVPLLKDGSTVPVYTLEYFLKKEEKLLAIDENGEIIPGTKPLRQGEENPIVTWMPTRDGLEPIGPDRIPVLVKSEDELVLQIKNLEYRISLKTLENIITKSFGLRYPNWRQKASKYVLDIILQFLESNDKIIIDFSNMPEIIQTVFPNIRRIMPLQFLSQFFTRLFQNLKPDYLPNKILVALKEIRHRILLKLPKPTVIKFVLYRQKYIPIGPDGKPLSEMEPIRKGEINSNIQNWLRIDGIMTPIGLDGRPMSVLKVPTIRHWFVINNMYVAFGEDGQPIPNFKPLSQGESHKYIIGWVTINGKYVPESWDHSIPLIDIVKVWVFVNGVFQPIGEDKKPVPGLPFLTPGELNMFISWINSTEGLKPIGPDGNELTVQKTKTNPPRGKVIRWIVINEYNFPIGIDDKPLRGYSPLKPGENSPLVSKWVLVNGKYVPLLSDGTTLHVYRLQYFLPQGGKLLAIDSNGESIPGIDLLQPGERNPFVTWKSTKDGLIPIGPDGRPILIKSGSVIVMNIRNKQYKISTELLEETITKIFVSKYSEWKASVSKLIVNAIVQFLNSEDELITNFDTIPEILNRVITNIRNHTPLEILFQILNKALLIADQDSISQEILDFLKEVRYRVQLRLPKPIDIKLILYNEKYIVTTQNGKYLLKIQPLESGEKNEYVQSWMVIDGIMKPVGSDGLPLHVMKIPIIQHWIVVGNKYFAVGTDERVITQIKPLDPDQRHPFVRRWVKIDGKLIPERPDGTVPPIDVVVNLKFSNGLYTMLRRDGNPVPGITPLAPGQRSPFLTWRYISTSTVPLPADLNGNLLFIIEESKISPSHQSTVIRWIKINNLYFPIGQDEQPIPGHSPLSPGDKDSLVSRWVIVDGAYVPLLTDGSKEPVFTLIHFLRQNDQLIAIGLNGEIIPGLGPLTPGEENYFVTWMSTSEGLIPIGHDGKPVLIQPVKYEEPGIVKWITVNNIYLPVDQYGKSPSNVPPLLLGKPSPYILKWETQGGRPVPVGLDGAPMLVEESGYETKLPSGIQIIWKLIDGKYVPFDIYGNILLTDHQIDGHSEVEKLLWNRLGSNFPNIYNWLNPILESLLQMKLETQRLSKNYFAQAPEEIVRVFPLPSKGRDQDMLKWLQTVLLTLTNPLPGGELDLGLVNILQKCADKLEYLHSHLLIFVDTTEYFLIIFRWILLIYLLFIHCSKKFCDLKLNLSHLQAQLNVPVGSAERSLQSLQSPAKQRIKLEKSTIVFQAQQDSKIVQSSKMI